MDLGAKPPTETWFGRPWNNLVVQVNVNLSPFQSKKLTLRHLKLLTVLLLFTRKWKTELTVSVFHEGVLKDIMSSIKLLLLTLAPALCYLELFSVLISNRKLKL